MAKKITIIRKYRPEFKRMRTMQTAQVIESIAQRTGLNEGEIRFSVYELRDTILDAHRHGQAVKIDGLGTFTPTLRLDGSVDILFRPEAQMLRDLNSTKLYATILNKANIGKSTEELVTKWNAEHPEDPVEEYLLGFRSIGGLALDRAGSICHAEGRSLPRSISTIMVETLQSRRTLLQGDTHAEQEKP